MRRSRHPSLASRSEQSRGYSLAEMLVVVVILGILSTVTIAAWTTYRRRTDVTQAARVAKTTLIRSRMLSVYRGQFHFFVLDPVNRRLDVYSDAGALGVFDAADARLSGEFWPGSVKLALPSDTSSLTNPLGGPPLTEAWSLPKPDPAARWGTSLLGVRTSSTGLMQTGEATPQVVQDGVFVFTDDFDQTVSVAIRGQTGSVRCFLLLGGSWKEL